jgi:hypothetical protein
MRRTRIAFGIIGLVAVVAGLVWAATLAGAGTHRREGIPDAEESEQVVAGPDSSTGSCGVERWSVKTGTDADAGAITLNSITQTTIAALDALPAPGTLPANNRVQPTETTVFRLAATLTQYKLEADSDYHLVLSDGAGHTMISEIPDPACVGAGSPLATGIAAARAQFDARYTPTGSFQIANVPVTLTGVGFFDFQHGQTGVAPNGIELHAVLNVAFGTGGNTVTVTNPGNQTNPAATPVSLQIRATDSAAGQSLTYTAAGLPTGLSINPGNGLITGTPTTAGTTTTTITATDTTGAAGTTTFGWTITTTSGCSGQTLGNPGFETGTPEPWSATPGVINNNTSEPAHTGTWDAWLDGYGTSHTDTLSQQTTIPAGCHATLTFWLHIDTAETTTTTKYDQLTITLGNTTLATYTNLDHHTAYTQHTLDLTPFNGQTLTLTYTGTEDTTKQTSFVLDDTTLTLT